MNTADISKLAKQMFNKVQNLNMESDEDLHKLFIKEYKKLIPKKQQKKGECDIGDYCGTGGCYRHMTCTFKDNCPKSKAIAIELGVYKETKQ